MASLSASMSQERRVIEIAVEPWFHDHHYAGKTVLPAVETMGLLADLTTRYFPDADTSVMRRITFPKFLELSRQRSTVPALVHFDEAGDHIRATLASKIRLKTCSKLQVHGEAVIPRQGTERRHSESESPSGFPDTSQTIIDSRRLYRELVPFGPAYQTLCGDLQLFERSAQGAVQTPDITPSAPDRPQSLGSPFALDGALHAACVCGQRLVDFIPFPIAIEQRVIYRPTKAGCRYKVAVKLTSLTDDEVVASLWISDSDGTICETAHGVRMRDVSRGTMRPPRWIKNQLLPR